MIKTWNVVSDEITEGGPPSGTTVIEATIDWIVGELPEAMIERGVRECYQYRSDPKRFHCEPQQDYPRNNSIERQDYRPLYLKSFSCIEDVNSTCRFLVTLNWDVPEGVQGDVNERLPPRRGQWSENRQSMYDPNKNGNGLHTTTAGEFIKGINDNFIYPTLAYTYRSKTIPKWFTDAQGGCVNDDDIRLDGEKYKKNTLMVTMATAEAYQDQMEEKEYYRDISLELAVNPDGWDRQHPNIGYYELKLFAQPWERKIGKFGDYFVLGDRVIDVYPWIENQNGVNTAFKLARDDKPYRLGNDIVKFRWAYEPIMTIINPRGNQDSKEVDKPVPLDKNGAALRDWNPGWDYTTTMGDALSISKPRPIPLKTIIEPKDLIILKLRTRKSVRMSEWGLW